ncbi:MAG: hypothetical protein EOP09_03430 [Proteobacteria bacterium]|nr:MAG: hypothetical protein EOP09_03430 [Pseudomonadota bacterium]
MTVLKNQARAVRDRVQLPMNPSESEADYFAATTCMGRIAPTLTPDASSSKLKDCQKSQNPKRCTLAVRAAADFYRIYHLFKGPENAAPVLGLLSAFSGWGSRPFSFAGTLSFNESDEELIETEKNYELGMNSTRALRGDLHGSMACRIQTLRAGAECMVDPERPFISLDGIIRDYGCGRQGLGSRPACTITPR